MRFDECEGLGKRPLDIHIKCPPNIEYPSPPDKVEIFFIGWNPPGLMHFWNDRKDKLFNDLTWVFEQLEWLRKYLVHAVKCWQEAKFSWDIPALPKTCLRNLLAKSIEELNPDIICALGKLPHRALGAIWPSEIPETIQLGHGWCNIVQGRKVVITTFPNWHWNSSEKQANRKCTVSALRRWRVTGPQSVSGSKER